MSPPALFRSMAHLCNSWLNIAHRIRKEKSTHERDTIPPDRQHHSKDFVDLGASLILQKGQAKPDGRRPMIES